MITIKSYTDLKQSKKLFEFLPIESADMYWCGEDLRIGGYRAMDTDYDTPCWSLAALLNILPNNDTDISKADTDTENDRYMCTVGIKGDVIFTFADNPIDACVEMILKLYKCKML